MKVSFRLSDADRERYGGDEWVALDTEQFADLSYDRLEELERDIKRHDKTSINKILYWEWLVLASGLGFRGMVWLARQLAGTEKPEWTKFKPNPHGHGAGYINHDLEDTDDAADDDADPPASGSSEPPLEPNPEQTTAKARTPRSKKD